jgi:hypothetical protein
MDKQEAELAALKNKSTPPVASTEVSASKPESYPQIDFHGFADVTYRANNSKGDNNTFVLGQVDFFLTSRLAENISILSETVIEGGADNNEFGIEMERLILELRPSEYFNVDIGRYHTAVGYYNTAYHHGSWFQTAVGRPAIFDFEDGGGIIPAHNVGISINGEIPSGSLGLKYIFEVGNGRAYQPSGTSANLVGNVQDDNEQKAFNFVITAKPDAIPGLHLGAGVYYDTLTSVTNTAVASAYHHIAETMVHGFLVYKSAEWEFLSEGYAIRHAVRADTSHWTGVGFAQIARKFGDITPYVRFSYLNAAASNPVYDMIGVTGLHYGPAVGVRYDYSALVAFKLQFDHLIEQNAKDVNQLTLQAAFTF